ncbi:four helix bundle protein [Halalkalibacter akibai]|uniref:S23 ribosomal protein n=1 Tax=Halalkalibacter akibai (strain ATCC 43226 / DSM 21942 / CIP 109018 / JCM 9157 / 1139) TaxID=1236973 RepID=W4QZZ4_HALA3|nr:four helix bundle protein [Halalkalibacter akibai]GAE37656.1 S23 ribosomal protein [Halalkalibacter akibai JCM 9157]
MTTKKPYVGNVRGLKVYRDALLFCKVMYEIAKKLPSQEHFLADVVKRSSCSIVANLAEGNTNFYYKKEYNHLNISLSKLAECRSALDLLRMQGYINDSVYKSADMRGEEILKMVIGMMRRIERQIDYNGVGETEIGNKSIILPINLSELFEKATTFNNLILGIIQRYPPTEKNGQIDQIMRASQSILQNLRNAENTSYPQQLLGLNTSLGSASECKAFFDISIMQSFITQEQYHEIDNLGGEILDSIIELMNQLEQKYEEEHKVVS